MIAAISLLPAPASQGQMSGSYHPMGMDPEDGRLCLSCHVRADYEASAHRDALSEEQEGGCRACHTQHGGAPASPLLVRSQRELCGRCHPGPAAAMAPGMPSRHAADEAAMDLDGQLTCGTCHDPHTVRQGTPRQRRLLTDPDDLARPRSAVPDDQSPHLYADDPTVAFTAATCGAPEARYRTLSWFFDGVPEPASASAERPPDTLATAAPDAPPARTAPDPDLPAEPGGSRHAPFLQKACERCHDHEADSGFVAPPDRLCWTCHEPEHFPGTWQHAPFGRGDCVACHDPHRASRERLLRDASDRELCGRCHDVPEVMALDAHRAALERCSHCHDPHASDRRFTLRPGIAEAPRRPASIVSLSPPWRTL